MVQQRARRQRSDDDDAEDQEIVERLNLGFFTRPIGLGEQRRAADEQEIPAHTEKHEGRQEMQQRRAAEGDDHMSEQQADADEQDGEDAEALNQTAGEAGRHDNAKSEKRRVGKEWVSTGRSRWWPVN